MKLVNVILLWFLKLECTNLTVMLLMRLIVIFNGLKHCNLHIIFVINIVACVYDLSLSTYIYNIIHYYFCI